jgi:hypothetical protein
LRVSHAGQAGASTRWVCHCSNPPILLAIYDASGRIEIRVRDRHYIARNRLQATCPRCGAQHVLEIPRLPERDDPVR